MRLDRRKRLQVLSVCDNDDAFFRKFLQRGRNRKNNEWVLAIERRLQPQEGALD